VTVVRTLVQTKLRINTHKRNNKKHRTNNKNTVYTGTHITKPTHTHTHTLQKKLKQPQYKIHPNEIVKIQSSTLSIRSP